MIRLFKMAVILLFVHPLLNQSQLHFVGLFNPLVTDEPT